MHKKQYCHEPTHLPATNRDTRWLRHAVELAGTSSHPTKRMSALAVVGGRLLEVGVNRARNAAWLVPWSACSFHAEQVLLRRRSRLSRATVYVARVDADGEPCMARPCGVCFDTLVAAGVRRLVWTGRNGSVGVEEPWSRPGTDQGQPRSVECGHGTTRNDRGYVH